MSVASTNDYKSNFSLRMASTKNSDGEKVSRLLPCCDSVDAFERVCGISGTGKIHRGWLCPGCDVGSRGNAVTAK
jgi:hypothetical protein